MYSILIVDDEKIIRNGLKDLIPWSQLNIESVYIASCAHEAMEIFQNHHIDILLTDICMPEMTGIELIEKLQILNEKLIILVLSGYNEFEYAQQCCQLQVRDFILKPIDEDILLASVSKQIQQLEESKKQQISNRAIDIHKTFYLEQRIREILHNHHEIQNTPLLEKYGYSESQSTQIALFVLSLNDEKNWQDNFEFQLSVLKNICIALVDTQQEGITFDDGFGNIGIVFFPDQSNINIDTKIMQIKTLLQENKHHIPKSVVGNPVNHFSKISISYHDALLSLQTHPVNIIQLQNEKSTIKRMQAFHQSFGELKMFMCTHINNQEQLRLGIKKIYDIFNQNNLSISLARRNCFELICAIHYAYYEKNIFESNEQLNGVFHALQVNDYQEVLAITTKFIMQLHQHIDQATPDIISRAKHYIHDHLTDDLTVTRIASYLFVNANYFSRLFKKNVGEGCNEYITRQRMEKAQALLHISSIPIGQIAEMVGYSDKNYFSLAFKKFTGASPTIYRQQIQEKCI